MLAGVCNRPPIRRKWIFYEHFQLCLCACTLPPSNQWRFQDRGLTMRGLNLIASYHLSTLWNVVFVGSAAATIWGLNAVSKIVSGVNPNPNPMHVGPQIRTSGRARSGGRCSANRAVFAWFRSSVGAAGRASRCNWNGLSGLNPPIIDDAVSTPRIC